MQRKIDTYKPLMDATHLYVILPQHYVWLFRNVLKALKDKQGTILASEKLP